MTPDNGGGGGGNDVPSARWRHARASATRDTLGSKAGLLQKETAKLVLPCCTPMYTQPVVLALTSVPACETRWIMSGNRY